MTDEQLAAQDRAPKRQFNLHRIYIKDISFESPSTPQVFYEKIEPTVSVELQTKNTRIGEKDHYEVTLELTVTAEAGESTVYVVEVQQAGIFHVVGIEGEALRQILATVAPSILFPYVRETIDSLVVKGGFPPLMLVPVNFDELYLQTVAQGKKETAMFSAGAVDESVKSVTH